MLTYIRRHIGVKLFLSYVVVILLSILVLATSAEIAVPSAYNRHMANMMGDQIIEMGPMGDMGIDLFTNFSDAFTDTLTLAMITALIASLIASLFISKQVTSPVREMMKTSQKIADGHYDQRVDVNAIPENGDELSQLAISFNQMAEKLYQTEKMRRQLIGDVTHELRTPLTSIKGSMEGLIDGALPATSGTFQNIYQEADRLQRLVNDLQELSRVESGNAPLELRAMDLEPVIISVVHRLQPQFAEKNITLTTDIPSNLPLVRIDQDRIAQVLINILGNALQYTPEGGHVSLIATILEQKIELCIKDSGIGISADHLPNLFTRFYRVDKSRSRVGGGSGIGLTIAKYLVEAHGGQIWAESDGEEKGSTFHFTIPSSS